MPQDGTADVLTGRSVECGLMLDLVAATSASPVVIIRGEPGIGKTSLLAWTREVAADRGMRTLAAAGTPAERELPFATLHQLLHSLAGGGGAEPWRRAVADVLEALQAPEAAGAALMRAAMSVLELFTEVARETGLLVVVDDVQWVDTPSRDVLSFVARRLGHEPVRLAIAGRDDRPDPLEEVALGQSWHTLRLGRLGDVDAAQLLDRVAPGLAADVRGRVLAEAAGNPLAIKELPRTVEVVPAEGGDVVPVSRRDEAFGHLRSVFDPHDVAHHQHFRTFLVSELAEAAAYGTQLDAARELVDGLVPRWQRTGSPILTAGMLVARALLAEESRKETLIEEALHDGLADWPLHRARLHLHHGTWLRRNRRISEARAPLHAAHRTFTAAGAMPWAERAAAELRAAGDVAPERVRPAWEHLTAQELQIASLAAAGLTNRQIGERLFLSHRTVGSHPYHVFPKLGISSRAQLGAALAGLEETSGAFGV